MNVTAQCHELVDRVIFDMALGVSFGNLIKSFRASPPELTKQMTIISRHNLTRLILNLYIK